MKLNERISLLVQLAGPMAMDPTYLHQLITALTQDEDSLGAEDFAKKLTPSKEQKIAQAPGGVALIPLHGVILQRAETWLESWGITSADRVGSQVAQAAADDSIKAIILHIESPGGSIYGLHEFAARINDAKTRKPVIAIADSYAASAAYWVGSQATELVVAPGGDVGSIGVYSMHQDISVYMEQMGVKNTLISAGEFKVEGNPFEPLTDEARKQIQERVDSAYKDFVSAVAEGRGVSTSKVLTDFGKGRLVEASAAIKSGMVDRVATLSETVSRFLAPGQDLSTKRARLALDQIP